MLDGQELVAQVVEALAQPELPLQRPDHPVVALGELGQLVAPPDLDLGQVSGLAHGGQGLLQPGQAEDDAADARPEQAEQEGHDHHGPQGRSDDLAVRGQGVVQEAFGLVARIGGERTGLPFKEPDMFPLLRLW